MHKTPCFARAERGSLIVGHLDDVQGLWTSQLKVVPERFVRGVDERPGVSPPASPEQQIPVIDMSKLILGNDQLPAKDEVAKLIDACQDWGFFQVVNHGIDEELMDGIEKMAKEYFLTKAVNRGGIEEELVEGIEKVAKEFFMLPSDQEKQTYPVVPDAAHGRGPAMAFPKDQKLDWSDVLALTVHPPSMRNPELCPVNPSGLGETLERYAADVRELCRRLLHLIAQGLGLRPTAFDEMFGPDVVQAVRMNYYPPCPQPDLVFGLCPHSDGSAVTVLQQESGLTGLQIVKDGLWVPVKPINNALVVNIGETFEVLTDGRFKSVEHRAVTNREKDRLSIATFYAPSNDVEIGPIPELVTENQPLMYRRYNQGEYSRHYLINTMLGKKTMEFAYIQATN